MKTAAPLLCIAALAASSWYAVGIKTDRDYATALNAYRVTARDEALLVSNKVGDAFGQAYQTLRTISLLKSVRNIDRHATNLSPDEHPSIQQTHNHLDI